MTEEYFKDHVLKCKKCGDIPLLTVETPMFSDSKEDKYRVICWSCKFKDGTYGNKTGLCKTPENALKAWNRRFGKKKGE